MDPDPFTLDATAARVLGCLIEKAMTTPDQYPMSLNGVRVACNQVSNRDPVVDYDETTVSQALRRLGDRGLAKMVHRPGDRVVKYIHSADTVFEIDPKETSLLAVLLLRGDQTPGELRQRTMRYIEFASLAEIETTLAELQRRTRPLVVELERLAGQKEHRYHVLLGERAPAAAETHREMTREAVGTRPDPDSEDQVVAPPASGDVEERVAELQREVTELRDRFERLLTELGVDDA
jgi:uncharacterized protein YceH (UPF0502 family)